MEKEKKEIYEKLIKIAQRIETFGLGCIVADNPFRAEENGGVWHCFVITQPICEKELIEEEFMSLWKKAQDSCQEIINADHLLLGFGPVLLVSSLEKWFIFLNNQDKHPILHGFPYGSTDVFLSKIIYGKEAHEKIIRAFQNKYDKNFIQECYSVWIEERKRRKEVIDVSNAKLLEEVEERKKPFNKFEIEEIKDFFLNCLEFSKENKISAIVGIDRSGRPLAQMLYKILRENGHNPVLGFLDPHKLTKAVMYKTADKPMVPDTFVEKFKREFPVIFQLLTEDSKKVLFIDDQVYSHFNTVIAIRQLLKQSIKKENFEFSFLVVSGFNGYNGLTWWKDKSLLRITSNKDCKEITLMSIPREINVKEETKIRDFEAKLSEIAEEVLNVWKTQNENCLVAR